MRKKEKKEKEQGNLGSNLHAAHGEGEKGEGSLKGEAVQRCAQKKGKIRSNVYVSVRKKRGREGKNKTIYGSK